MKKRTYISLIIALLTVLGITIFFLASAVLSMPKNNAQEVKEYSYTKAVCENGKCQDYVILCSGEEVISKTPITGAAINIPNGWQDPRSENLIKGFCNFSK
jgi:hypothetical protein